MIIKKYVIYSAIKPHLTKEVSARERAEYLKCKFWKNSKHEAWMFFYCYFPPSAAPSLCRLLLVLSGRLFKLKGFDEAIITAWNLSAQYGRNVLDINLIDDPKYKKIIEAFDDSYPREGLLDDIILWAKDKKLITNAHVTALRKNIESIRSSTWNHDAVSEAVLMETLNLLIENNLHTPILYSDSRQLLFPNYDLLDELQEQAYHLSNSDYFYFGASSLMKWLIQQGYLSDQLTKKFRALKVESIKESAVTYRGRFNSLQKLIQQGADRDDLLFEALQEKPLYWKYPIDCKCKRNMDSRCICNNGVRWEEIKPWVKYEITAKQRLDGFGQLKQHENDDTFLCRFGGLAIDMLRHNKLPKTAINHYQIELVPTNEEIIYGLQPYIKVSQNELMMAIADDRIGFLEADVQSLVRKLPEIIPQKMSTIQIQEPVFYKNGDLYEITYQSKAIQLPCSVGLNRLAYLIQNPNIKITPLELAQKFNKSNYDSQIEHRNESVVDLSEQGINSDAFYSVDLINDKQAQIEYKNEQVRLNNEIKNLKEEEEEAEERGDLEKAEALKELQLKKAEQLNKLLQFIQKDQNLKGKSRHHKNDSEKARSAVQQTIKNAIKKIASKHPELRDYLTSTVETGYQCRYLPR